MFFFVCNQIMIIILWSVFQSWVLLIHACFGLGTFYESLCLALEMIPFPIGWPHGGWWIVGGKRRDKRSKCLLSCLHIQTHSTRACLSAWLLVDAKQKVGEDLLSKHCCWRSLDLKVWVHTHTHAHTHHTHTHIHTACLILFEIRLWIIALPLKK